MFLNMFITFRVNISNPVFITTSTTLLNIRIYNLNFFTSTPKNTFAANRHHKCITFHNF